MLSNAETLHILYSRGRRARAMLARDDSPVALLRKPRLSVVSGQLLHRRPGASPGLFCRGLSGREFECRARTHASYLPFFALLGRAVGPGPRLRRASRQEEMGKCGSRVPFSTNSYHECGRWVAPTLQRRLDIKKMSSSARGGFALCRLRTSSKKGGRRRWLVPVSLTHQGPSSNVQNELPPGPAGHAHDTI